MHYKIYSLLASFLKNDFIILKNFFTQTQVSVPVRKYRIFMCMLSKEDRRYPLQAAVIVTARVLDFIGLICYKYAIEHPDHNLKSVISYFIASTHDTYS